MIDWAGLTLILYIIARMSGFVLFNPILNRGNIQFWSLSPIRRIA